MVPSGARPHKGRGGAGGGVGARAGRQLTTAWLLAALWAGACGPAGASEAKPAPARAFDHTHAAWTKLLAAYVDDGVVDYSGLRAHGRAALESYLEELAAPRSMEGWTREQQMAFWINAYNAWTVERVLEAWPVKSFKKLDWPRGPWKREFVRLGLSPEPVSLDWIEHEVLRKRYAEPRIHMALVCASRSCPALRSEAYVAARLDAQLEDQARRFVGDPAKNRLDAEAGVLWLSKIFDWYGEDFERGGGSVRAFVAAHLPADAAARVRDGSLDIRWLDYDWSLNGR
ncbi:MAG: DUF547 domain-containing protein [Deltaproteobacteria bacterium]|nr:DUF547 domain-containing protein [Deltaproteobacteria bacterium]